MMDPEPLAVRYCDTYNPDTGYCTHADNRGGLPPEPHAYRHALSDDAHEPLADCPCYYCHRLPAEHVDELPAGAELDDDTEQLGQLLYAAYVQAVERVRDRAQEARAGGRYMRRHVVPVGPRDLAELVRRDRRDRHNWTAATQADERLGVPLRDTPIGAAGLAID